MYAIELLKDLDKLACDVNRLWHRCERIKHEMAEHYGISNAEMERNGIFTDSSAKTPTPPIK